MFSGGAAGTSTAAAILLGATSPSAPTYGASTTVLNYDGASYSTGQNSLQFLTKLY